MRNQAEMLDSRDATAGQLLGHFLSKLLMLLSLAVLGAALLLLLPVAQFYINERDIKAFSATFANTRYVHGTLERYSSATELHLLYDERGKLQRLRAEISSYRYPSPRTFLWDTNSARMWLNTEKILYLQTPPEELERLLPRYGIELPGEVATVLAAQYDKDNSAFQMEREDGQIIMGIYQPSQFTEVVIDSRTHRAVTYRQGTPYMEFGPSRLLRIHDYGPTAPEGIFDPQFPPETVMLMGADPAAVLMRGELEQAPHLNP